jgi:hypothetical protein
MSSYAYNPQLPPVPQGVWTDATFAADEAKLRADTIRAYHDDLRQLGYTDDQGNFIPGTVEVEANRRRGELAKAMSEAELGVTRNAQREGTLFSGIRADRTGEAQFPYRTESAQLEEDIPKQLSSLYEHAGGLLNDYTLGRNQLLAGAASRYEPPAIVAPVAGTGTAPAAGGPYGGANPSSTYVTPAGTPPAAAGTLPDYAGADQSGYFPGSPTSPVYSSGGKYVNPNDPDYRNRMARGGIVDGPTDALIGEEGPEAVVPLRRGRKAAIAKLRQMLSGGRRRGDKTFGQGIDEFNYNPGPSIPWGGQNFVDPAALVAWMNARGADTSVDQFLGNHPGVAAEYGQRQAQPQAPQQRPQQQQQGLGGQQKKAVPNVHAKGLKAAASVLNELAKHHEEDHQIRTAQPPTRVGGPRLLGPPVHPPEMQADRNRQAALMRLSQSYGAGRS